MATVQNTTNLLKIWLLVLPVLALFYIGLFITMWWWYPAGLSVTEWQAHLLHFSIVYVLWLATFFTYRLFDLDTLRAIPVVLGRLAGALVVCVIIAAVYFYFQPQLLLTPRRFLLVHMILTGCGITFWYAFMFTVLPRSWKRVIFAHAALEEKDDLVALVSEFAFTGIQYGGVIAHTDWPQGLRDAVVVFPARTTITADTARTIFELRSQQVRFVEFHELYERLTRTVHLQMLDEIWFLQSVDYGSHRVYDTLKRLIDIIAALVGFVVWVILFPFIFVAIKLDSRGPVFFVQERVGLHGKSFRLYKYRTMAHASPNNIWTTEGDARITSVGRVLRKLRLDELPQLLNIIRGEMSVVGPRPEQVHFVEQLRAQIPYYDERHIVKPGLTGWAQLHVYAGTLAETKRKLQYDLYYIKHRSILFDMEIVLKTIYNILAFGGR